MIGFDQDCVERFVFEDARVRGEVVRLDGSWREIVRRHRYPTPVQDALGELSAACVLMAATLKIQGGGIVLQIQGGSPVGLLVVECQADLTLRATAMWEPGVSDFGPDHTLRGLALGGRCVLTIDPGQGEKQLYQSVVPLEGVTTAEVLERYMARSEQIESRFLLAANGERAAGLLLQKMPGAGGRPPGADDPGLWARVGERLDHLSPSDILSRPLSDVMRQLLAGDRLSRFDTMSARFQCRCSRDKVAGVIRMIGAEEARSVIDEQGHISVTCEFCRETYVFDPAQTEAALSDEGSATPIPA
jgi:molecular chaperone Hsp33